MKTQASLLKFGISAILSALIGFEFYFLISTTENTWYLIGALAATIIGASLITSDFKFRQPSTFLFPLLALFFGLGIGLNLFIAFGPMLKYIFIGFNCVVLTLLFTFFSRKDSADPEYKSTLLDDIGQLIHLYILFLLTRGVLGIFSFTREYLWIFLVSLIGFIALQAIIFFWQHRILSLRAVFYITLISLLLSELTWVITLWPISYSSASMIITVSGYLFFGLLYTYERKGIDRAIVRSQLGFSLFLFLLIVGTSRWTPL